MRFLSWCHSLITFARAIYSLKKRILDTGEQQSAGSWDQWLSRAPMRMRSSSICSACSAQPALPTYATSAMQILHGEFFLAISVSKCALFIIIMIASKGLNLLTLVVKSENLNTTHH